MERDVLRRYIGLKLNIDVTTEEIMKFARGNSIRIIYPNTPVTLDLRPNRVNIHLDFDNTIQNVDKF